jgi:hypothetical protein
MSMFLVIALGTGWSQENNGGAVTESNVQGSLPQAQSGDSMPHEVDDFPASDSGQWSIEPPPASSRSYLLAGISASEGAQSNPSWTSQDSSQVVSATNLSGAFDLVLSRRRSETGIDYLGSDTFYSSYGSLKLYNQPYQHLNAYQRIFWPRGHLTFRNLFGYISEANFGSSSLGGVAGSGGLPPFLGVSQVGEVGQAGYLTNVSSVDVTEALRPRSSVFLAAAYSITDYLGNGGDLFNSRQASTRAGYNYILTRRDTVGIAYGYRRFDYPVTDAGKVVTNSVQLVFQRQVSGRMDMVLAAGPEFINLSGGVGQNSQIGATVRAALHYRWERSSLIASYNRLVTAGSGVFLGGTSDIVLFSVHRTISRIWQAQVFVGYTHVSALGLTSAAIAGNSYQYWSAGSVVRRRLGRSLSTFASYQFNEESSGGCGPSAGCIPAIRPQRVSIGLAWSIRPIRLE